MPLPCGGSGLGLLALTHLAHAFLGFFAGKHRLRIKLFFEFSFLILLATTALTWRYLRDRLKRTFS